MSNRQRQNDEQNHVPSELTSPNGNDPTGDAPPVAGEIHSDSGVRDGQPFPESTQTSRKGKSGQKKPGQKAKKPGPPDPFGGLIESDVLPLLEPESARDLQATTVVDRLIDQYPDRFVGMKRRSLYRYMQKYLAKWRKKHGVEGPRSSHRPVTQTRGGDKRPRLTMEQEHPPGREAQIDFTGCESLGVTIGGEHYPHKLFVFRLSHSGWMYVEVTKGETGAALMQGLQGAMRALGGVPEVVRSDNSSCVIHKGRPTRPYREFLTHYGLQITLINPGCPWENGGAERSNGIIKNKIHQNLLIRHNRGFAEEKDYANFVQELVDACNRRPEVQSKLAEERAWLRPLPPKPAPEHVVITRKVQGNSLITVAKNSYSVPARALGENVTVHLYADHLEVYRNGRMFTRWDRLRGQGKVVADPRHLIHDVLQRWRGFERWNPDLKRFMFPMPVFRKCHDGMRKWDVGGRGTGFAEANYGYLRILDLALTANREAIVAEILEDLLEKGSPFGYEDAKRELGTLLGWPEDVEVDGMEPEGWWQPELL